MAKSHEGFARPVFGTSHWSPLEEFSSETGWRGPQPSVVASYVHKFPESFGRSVLGGVKGLAKDAEFNSPGCDSEGKIIVDDGLSTIAALKAIKECFVQYSVLRGVISFHPPPLLLLVVLRRRL